MLASSLMSSGVLEEGEGLQGTGGHQGKAGGAGGFHSMSHFMSSRNWPRSERLLPALPACWQTLLTCWAVD